jgi:hypothetical protein
LIISTSAQTTRSSDDPRNTAPTVGTGGPPGGPTGLFTVYDGQTLRRGEFTFSAAYSNYDRDPGNVDISEVPVSFQIGLSDHLELWFNTDAYRAIKVNSPRNLSSFYLPNSSLVINGVRTSGGAIVLAPQGPGTSQFPGFAVFRPVGSQPFLQFPFVGGSAGNFGFDPRTGITAGGVFGFPTAVALIGAPRATGNNGSADNFPGLGSAYGSILPGIVLQTGTITTNNGQPAVVPTSFTVAPSYLPDAPFINRRYGESAFNTFTVGAKYRFTGPNNPYGIGLIPFYRFYADNANDFSGFNQLQRGASPGGGSNPFSGDSGRGDFGLVAFGDARLGKHVNLSGNIGYIYNSSVKADFPTGTFTILDRPDEILAGIGVDFPINKYFQPIFEFRSTQYAGGRTPNAFENSPLDAIAGFRFFPTRYISMGAAYRYHANEQDAESFNQDDRFTNRTTVANSTLTSTSTFSGVPPGFLPSEDPHGFILQVTAGRRNARQGATINGFANVTNLELSETTVTNGCPAGQVPAEGVTCSPDMIVDVRTTAVDPENDVLTYVYTVSGGRITGTGANVAWDLTGVSPGTYTITAGVDDSCGVCGTTQTKTVTVANCNCVTPVVEAPPCICPTITVTGPADITAPGATMTFTANVSGGSDTNNPTYNWTVSQGDIVSGQGTSTITVQTSEAMQGGNVTATVEVGGLCETCQRTYSETAGIEAIGKATPFGNPIETVAADELKATLDQFFTELQNQPTSQGYIINYGTSAQIAKRERDIRSAIRFRKFPAERVTLLRGTEASNTVRSELFIAPAGAPAPTPR